MWSVDQNTVCVRGDHLILCVCAVLPRATVNFFRAAVTPWLIVTASSVSAAPPSTGASGASPNCCIFRLSMVSVCCHDGCGHRRANHRSDNQRILKKPRKPRAQDPCCRNAPLSRSRLERTQQSFSQRVGKARIHGRYHSDEGKLNVDLVEFQMNLMAYPRIHFMRAAARSDHLSEEVLP